MYEEYSKVYYIQIFLDMYLICNQINLIYEYVLKKDFLKVYYLYPGASEGVLYPWAPMKLAY